MTKQIYTFYIIILCTFILFMCIIDLFFILFITNFVLHFVWDFGLGIIIRH